MTTHTVSLRDNETGQEIDAQDFPALLVAMRVARAAIELNEGTTVVIERPDGQPIDWASIDWAEVA